jgi:subtilisin family serine protease
MSRILVSTLAVVLITSLFVLPLQMQYTFAKPEDRQTKARVRVIAESEDKAAAAASKGCDTVRETRGLKAFLCTADVAESLGLQEDIRVFKADTGANIQIGANQVQSSGDNGEGRKIVVLDTGYNYNHRELKSSYLGGKDFVNNDNNPMDDNGHGSHVAGLITADGIKPSARGTAPKAGIISGKVLDKDGSGYFSDVVAAIYWAVDGPDGKAGTSDDFKADAINLSMGTEPPYTYKYYCDSEIPSMTAAIKYAVDRKVTVVAASGNYGTYGVSIPGCISYALTVGAVNSNDNVASFSGRGRPVDLTAPGTDLTSAWLGTSTYVTTSGTSMATPIVSGTIALIKHDHPWYSSTKVQSVLKETAVDLGKEGRDWHYGYGRIVAPAAVD